MHGKFMKHVLTEEQIWTETLKQFNWLYSAPMQKQWITLSTNRWEVYERSNTFKFMGCEWALPEQITIEFLLTNDHIEREENE